MFRRQTLLCLVVGAVSTAWGQTRQDSQSAPLHDQIDAAISTAHFGNVAETAPDAEFLRRVYLDFVGRSPTVEEARAFLAAADPSKRSAVIDRLIHSDEFNDFFAAILDVMLMERRDGKRISQAEWRAFLRRALAEQQPLDQLVQTILTADGSGDMRGASKFLLDREVEPNAVTRDVGRIFFGRDLQCAQCHDHPNIDDYLQAEYYGIYAFVNRSYLFEDPADNKKAYVGEKAEGNTEFKSVFLPDDGTSQTIPRFDGEDAYVIAPSAKAAGVPRFSRRAQLARLVTHPSNEHFSKNVVNRLWDHLLGRGIVDPVDFHHADNPPSHPALLQTLADEFVAMGFDLREFLRQIALSKTYQRSVEFPSDTSIAVSDLEAEIQNLNAATAHLAAQLDDDHERPLFATRLRTTRADVAQLDETISSVAQRMEELGKQQQDLSKTRQELDKQQTAKQSQLAAMNGAVAAAQAAVDALPNDTALTTALAEYKQRAEKLKQDVEATQQSIAENQKKSDSLVGQRASEELQLANDKAKRIGLVDMVAEARGALGVFRARHQNIESSWNEKRQRLAALTAHQDYLAKWNLQQSLAARHAELAAAPTIPDTVLQEIEVSVAAADRKVAEQRERIDSLLQVTTTGAELLTKNSAALDSLQAAITQAQSAAAQLADVQLNTTVETLATQQATLGEELAVARKNAEQQNAELEAAHSALNPLIAAHDERVAERETLRAQVARREQDLATAKSAYESAVSETKLAYEQLRMTWERRFAVRSLSPLTPEQLAGSTIAALGLKARFQQEAEQEWQNNNKDKKPEELDATKKQDEIAALLQKRMTQVESTYISLFAAPSGAPQDVFSATADQALFLANDGRVQNWLSPGEGTLVKRLQAMDDPQLLAEELHLAILSRSATDIERQEITEYLARRTSDRNKAIQELAWGLLSSLEFRFNH